MQALFRSFWGPLAVCVWVCGIAPLLAAEMPSRIYTTQDGLVRDDVRRIRRDSRGYLWFGTAEGLSIFDGYQFTNYTVNDGLPNRSVEDILETLSGEYWLATYRGLCRFDPKAAPERQFTPYPVTPGPFAEQVNVLIERRDRSIWFGTEGGLWRLRRDDGRISAERVRLPSPRGDAQRIFALREDGDGNLWAAASDGLYAIWRDARVTRFGDGVPEDDAFLDVLPDHQGRLWALNPHGVLRIDPHPKIAADFIAHIYPMIPNPTALFESSDGKLWVSSQGLYEFNPEAPERDALQRVAQALGGDFLGSPEEDADHNLWVAGPGALKVTRHGFTTYSTADGLKSLRFQALTEDRSGRFCPIANVREVSTIHEFDGRRFTAVSPHLPSGFRYAWGDAQISFQDREGDWWIPTYNGVLRFAPPARIIDLAQARPKGIYTSHDGLPDQYVLRLFEDSRGDVWIGVWRGLALWRRSTGKLQAFSASDGLRYVQEQPPALGTPQALTEDRAGQIWLGFHPTGVARFRGGRFEYYSEGDGVPKGQIHTIYRDHAGRLWIGSSQGGVARIDDVTAGRPSFRSYTIEQGLSSNQVFTIVEDAAGRIYLGGGRGVDRLDPDSGSVRHFTAADGLPAVRVIYSHRDRTGALWFAGLTGLSRYVPEPDPPARPQPPLIRSLRIAGNPSSISVLGESTISDLKLRSAQNNLQIEFSSLHFASGEVLRYQYRLEGADHDWNLPAGQRTVHYSSLSPGTYRFVVKAVNGEGLESAQHASVSFIILPPVWRQAWFVMLMACGLAATLYAGHRYRVRQLLHLERIRTRLASDLHDDIGSGLAEIAILTDVAEVQPVPAGGDLIRRAGDRARQLREAMSDIVWSVDPQHGNLTDLIGRVRQSVFSLMESNGRRVIFEGPEGGAAAGLPLAPDRARHVLLITKEALTNIVRHADASEVAVRLKLENRRLVLEVRDDGRGFDPAGPHSGMGLRNLRRRAAESGGELMVESSPGQGARLTLSLPLG
ncbi:MAG: ATP-binding protein [Acidobacteriia bacterium]|nr:ATP-binding protein [Terriglobia bacterium]